MIRRRIARLAVGAAVLTAVASGLLATRAAAGPASSTSTVSVSTPSASKQRHTGKCPTTITFSSKVTLKVSGKTTLSYRWLHGDGSKSTVKTQTVRGNGTKTVTVTDQTTFSKDTNTWRALQVLSPREVTSGKAQISVSCHDPKPKASKPTDGKPQGPSNSKGKGKDVGHDHNKGHGNNSKDHENGKGDKGKDDKNKKKPVVEATVSVPDHTGPCSPSARVTATGVIEVRHPTWVAYGWLHNGKLVDAGIVKVDSTKTLTYAFTPKKNQTGSVSLVVAAPYDADTAKDTYVVTCEEQPPPPPPVEASASVTAPADLEVVCPTDVVFTGTVSVTRIDAGGTTVRYRWAGPGWQGPTETLTFTQGDPLSQEVTLPEQVTATGTVQRWIEILSPNTARSNTDDVRVECTPVTVRILELRPSFDTSVCGTPGSGPAVHIQGVIRVNGPTRVEYEWEFDDGLFVVPGSFETTGPEDVTISHRLESSPFTAQDIIRVRLRITSPDTSSVTYDFSPPSCPST